MAQVFLQHIADQRGLPLSLESAGLLPAGRAPTPEAVAVMRTRGFDTSRHRSRGLRVALTQPPDLVIGLAGEHVEEVLERRPELASRTFTLRELVRLALQAGARRGDEELDGYLGRLDAQRGGAGADDDIADPIGQSLSVYEACAAEIEGLVEQAAALLWPVTPS